MIDLGALKIGIETDADKANKELSSVGDTADKQESKFSKLGGGMKKGLAVGAGAVVAVGTSMMAFAKKSADATDEIDKQSQKIGISRQGYQEMSYILSQNGTDVSVLQRGFKTLNDRMNESIEGTGKGAEAFTRLGLSATDLNGEMKTQEQVFDEAARALMQMPEGAEKSQLAFELFGKAGQELMPLLNGTEEGMDALRESAHEMGLVLSDEAVDAGAAFTDTMDNVERSLGAVVSNIGVQVMPIFQKFLDWVLAHMPEIQKVIGKVFDAIGGFVKTVVKIFETVLIPAFQFVYDKTNEYFPAVQEIFKKVFEAIQGIVKVFVDIFTMIWTEYGENIKNSIEIVWNLIKGIFEVALNLITEIVNLFIALFKGDWQAMGDAIKGITDTFWNLIKLAFSTSIALIKEIMTIAITTLKNVATLIMTAIWDAFKDVWDLIIGWVDKVFPGLGDTITGFKDKFVESGKAIFQGVWDGMKNIWSSLKSWVDDKVSWLSEKLRFWEKSSRKMESEPSSGGTRGVDGRHKAGLAYVPFDGYRAELHKGEEVLRASDPRNQNNNKTSGINQTVNIYSPKALSPSETARLQKRASRQMAMGWGN